MLRSLIIVPCYNEANRIPLDEFAAFMQKERLHDFSFLFVNDGSQDGTAALLKDFCEKENGMSFLDLEQNVGKAEAIRAAVNQLNEIYDYIGYFDADLATPLAELNRFADICEQKGKPDMVLGSRIKILGMTKINRKLSRHYIGRIFATIVSNMLRIPIYDTQCGAKMIHFEKAKSVFQEAFSSKWLFDVELLFRLKKLGDPIDGKIIEVPLNEWEDKAGSKIKLTYYLQAPIDLLRIYLRYS